MKNILHYFDQIKDNRKNQGKRYKPNSILALITLGYMHGCKSLAAISRFGKKLTKSKKRRLGFMS
ncbi:MAG: transposase family protein, partial [Rickettsiaceae bacterium]|nr:transposase family protein [Rickettsiaceae bacterium]